MSEMDLKTVTRGIQEARRAARPGHPSPEDLLGYHAGELQPEVMEEVREHLSSCPDCMRAVLDMARFPAIEPIDGASRVTEDDLPRRWEKVRGRLRQEEEAPRGDRPSVARPDFGWRGLAGSTRFLRSAAAALLLVSAGLSVALLEQRRPQNADPRLNLVIAELVPIEEAGQRTGEIRVVRVPEGSGGAVLTLALLEATTHAQYEVRFEKVSDAGREVVWETAGLERTSEGIVVLELPRRFLPPGRYQIELSGLEGDHRETVASYRVELQYE